MQGLQLYFSPTWFRFTAQGLFWDCFLQICSLEFPVADGHIEVGPAHLERKVRSSAEDSES